MKNECLQPAVIVSHWEFSAGRVCRAPPYGGGNPAGGAPAGKRDLTPNVGEPGSFLGCDHPDCKTASRRINFSPGTHAGKNSQILRVQSCAAGIIRRNIANFDNITRTARWKYF